MLLTAITGIPEDDAVKLFNISRTMYWKCVREAGQDNLLTTLRYLRRKGVTKPGARHIVEDERPAGAGKRGFSAADLNDDVDGIDTRPPQTAARTNRASPTAGLGSPTVPSGVPEHGLSHVLPPAGQPHALTLTAGMYLDMRSETVKQQLSQSPPQPQPPPQPLPQAQAQAQAPPAQGQPPQLPPQSQPPAPPAEHEAERKLTSPLRRSGIDYLLN